MSTDYNIKDIQKIELEILSKFKEICEKYKLEYFLDSGTALGAIRHKGFIPWDDDIDVGMPREDYEKFLEVGQDELGDEFFLQNLKSEENTPFLFSKIRKNGTVFLEWNKRNINMHHGIYIDVFPYDYLPRDSEAAKEYINNCIKFNNRFLTMSIPDRSMQPNNSIKWIIGAAVRRMKYYFLKFYSKPKFAKKCNEVFTAYNQAEYKSDTLFSPVFCGDYRFEKNIMLPSIEMEFEGSMFKVPRNYHEYLTILYGDYMKLPDEKDRVGHRPVKVEIGD